MHEQCVIDLINNLIIYALTYVRKCDCTLNCIAQNNLTAVHYASWSGHDKLFRSLINHGADVNARNTVRCTSGIVTVYI